MRKARREALHKVLGDSFNADTSGAAVVTQAVLFENDEEIMSLRRREEKKRLEGLIERHNGEAEARVVAVAPVESDDEMLALRKALQVAELNAKIREANLRGRGSGDCAAPGPMKMYSKDGEPGSKGMKRPVSGVDDVARRKKVPKKAPKQAHEYTENQRRRQESKRDHLCMMNVVFNSLARDIMHDVRRSFITGSFEQKLNREKGLPGCFFLPPIWEEIRLLNKDVCDDFRAVFGAKKALYGFEQNHPAFYEWHLRHETDM
ncbi:unnamed protein product [Ectocarpus sp. 4 AP-2014]